MKKFVVFAISVYKKSLSQALYYLIGAGCRYMPTCADYAKESVNVHGVKRGLTLSFKRIVHCHPFAKRSFIDPVPAKL